MSGHVDRSLVRLVLGVALMTLAGQSGCAGSGISYDGSSGSRLYRARCRSCHALIDPGTRDLEWWHTNLDRYAQRAHLTTAERDSVMSYVERIAITRPQHQK